jgi:uncharacterized SAM-binding protein YcdF (DUF218 family)|uniref:ElyC/SanA/YdcF family protein n=1 Tax=Cephaloticoccus sp. TaxID=1985742 RepID=UPI00404B158B
MFWLKKAISTCLMPFPAILGLMIAGLLLSRRKGYATLGKGMILTGILLLVVLSNRQVGLALIRPLEQRYPPIPETIVGEPIPDQLAACRYIVVLGGGHADAAALPATSRLSVYALGRITEGVRLARLLPHAKIITSGPGQKGELSHAETLAAAAISLGVSPDRFIMLDSGRDTEGEAAAIRSEIGDAPFALVTSAWHMPRAMALMQHAGLNALACPTDFHARTNDRFTWTDYLCGLDGLENSTWAVYERLGYRWAKWRGKIN